MTAALFSEGDYCRQCQARVENVWVEEAASFQITIDARPTTKRGALLAIAAGLQAVVGYDRKRKKRDWYHVHRDRFSLLSEAPHIRVEHNCRFTPEPAPVQEAFFPINAVEPPF